MGRIMRWIGLLIIAVIIGVTAIYLSSTQKNTPSQTPSNDTVSIPSWYIIELNHQETWHILPGGRVEWVRWNDQDTVKGYAPPALLGNGVYQAIQTIYDNLPPERNGDKQFSFRMKAMNDLSLEDQHAAEIPPTLVSLLNDLRQVHPAILSSQDEAYLHLTFSAPQPKQLPATFINRTVDDGINQRNVLIPLNDQDLATLPDQAAIAVALSDEVVVSGQVVTGSTTSGQADEKQSQN